MKKLKIVNKRKFKRAIKNIIIFIIFNIANIIFWYIAFTKCITVYK